MSVDKQRFQPLLSAGLVFVLAAACPGESGTSSRANATWAERLTQQAGYIQQETQRTDRAGGAWAQRLEAQARAHQREQARAQRASQAWSDRLSGIARRSASR